jgi:hypothetical protein
VGKPEKVRLFLAAIFSGLFFAPCQSNCRGGLRCCCGIATCAPEGVEQQIFAVAMDRWNRIVAP